MELIRIKSLLAFILLICACLPLSNCEVKAIPQQYPQPSERNIDSPQPKENVQSFIYQDDFIPIKELEFDDLESWIFIFPFIWPIIIIPLQKKSKSILLLRLLFLFEFILIGFSTYSIVSWVFFLGDPLFAGYLATICIGSYLLIFIYEHLLPQKWKENLTSGCIGFGPLRGPHR